MSAPSVTFTIAGDLVLSLRKRLRVAIPKKAFASSTTVEVIVGDHQATFSLSGAAISLAATTSGSANITMPWRQFQPVLSEPFDKGRQVTFSFVQGEFTLDGVTSRSRAIDVQVPATETEGASRDRVWADVRGALSAPLLAAYRQTRLEGVRLGIADQALLRQQLETERILADALRLLEPLGVARSDLERILDAKAGIPGA